MEDPRPRDGAGTEPVNSTDDSPSQGLSVRCSENERFNTGLDWAIDYRGDVTLLTSDGSELECYVFSRSTGPDAELHCLAKGEDERRSILVESIKEIRFSGKDTAAGKSFERWIERYLEKKIAGEEASIECENLDE